MNAKIQKLSNTTSPWGGINFILKEFDNLKIGKLIDNQLGIRGTSAAYSYSEIFKYYWSILFCGGDCAEDIQSSLRQTLESIPYSRVPSADTLLRGIKELAVEDDVFESDNLKKYHFNINRKMNKLNLLLLLRTNQLQKGEMYDFDYDNQVIATEKHDAERTYKDCFGYFPGVASIGDKIVYVENRAGNANVKFLQDRTLHRAFTLLESEGIHINRARMDAGSYSKDIINEVAQHCCRFYIRANSSKSLRGEIDHLTDWKKVEINYKQVEVASLPFTSFFEDRHYRLVVSRECVKTDQLNLFTSKEYIYRSILTNDYESSELDVITYYNQRGSIEKQFDIQNNDFSWNKLPCSDMKDNTVFLLLMAMAKNFYNVLVRKIASCFTNIHSNTRLKRFIFQFVSVSARWVRHARQWTLQLFTDKPYDLLM